MKIQESAENYLESVLILQKQKGHVRSIDIVNYLDFSKPSVSVAMKNLRENAPGDKMAGRTVPLSPGVCQKTVGTSIDGTMGANAQQTIQ